MIQALAEFVCLGRGQSEDLMIKAVGEQSLNQQTGSHAGTAGLKAGPCVPRDPCPLSGQSGRLAAA